MSETGKSNGVSVGMIVLIASIALNGLLGGYLLAKSSAPTPTTIVNPETPQRSGPDIGDARHIVGGLDRDRRREILDTAFKNLNIERDQRPRALMQQRRKAQQRAKALGTADPLDRDALKAALQDVRAINTKLAVQGDALVLEVLSLMTAEERQQASQNNRKRRQDRQRRRQNRQQD